MELKNVNYSIVWRETNKMICNIIADFFRFFRFFCKIIHRAIEQCSKNQKQQPPPAMQLNNSLNESQNPCNKEVTLTRNSPSEMIRSAFRPIAPSSSASAITSSTFHQISAHLPTQNPSNYTSLIAYPNKWFLPIPAVTMSHHHLTSFPRCTLANCSLCLHHPAAIWKGCYCCQVVSFCRRKFVRKTTSRDTRDMCMVTDHPFFLSSSKRTTHNSFNIQIK